MQLADSDDSLAKTIRETRRSDNDVIQTWQKLEKYIGNVKSHDASEQADAIQKAVSAAETKYPGICASTKQGREGLILKAGSDKDEYIYRTNTSPINSKETLIEYAIRIRDAKPEAEQKPLTAILQKMHFFHPQNEKLGNALNVPNSAQRG